MTISYNILCEEFWLRSKCKCVRLLNYISTSSFSTAPYFISWALHSMCQFKFHNWLGGSDKLTSESSIWMIAVLIELKYNKIFVVSFPCAAIQWAGKWSRHLSTSCANNWCVCVCATCIMIFNIPQKKRILIVAKSKSNKAIIQVQCKNAHTHTQLAATAITLL